MEVVVAIYKALASVAAKIPGEAWAALIAIGGVLLASHAARKEGAKQRLFDMRREVYLHGAEAIARANTLIGRMADAELPNTEIARTTNETIAQLAKVQTVASIATVRAVSEYMSTLTECMSALWPRRWELIGRAHTLAALQEQITALLADSGRWLEQIKQASVQGLPMDALRAQFQASFDLRAQVATQHEALRLVQAREGLELVELCLQQSVPMLEAIPRVMAQVRAELDLPGDETEVQEILARGSLRQVAAARALAEKAREIAATQAAALERPPGPPAPPAASAR